MEKLTRIGILCKQLGTTNRSVRYYEEMGLLTSVRPFENNYRYFNEENCNNLRMILFLRSLNISIKDISDIFKQADIKKLIKVLEDRTEEIDRNINNLSTLKDYIHKLLKSFREYRLDKFDSFMNDLPITHDKVVSKTNYKEAFLMLRQHIQALNDDDVKIVKLPDMLVAYTYSGLTTNPEGKAIDEMMDNVREHKLYTRDDLRFFGFDNPSPKSHNFDQETYGYEMWLKLPSGTLSKTNMKTKNVKGGLYATVSFSFSSGTDMIPKRWQQLIEWVKNSKYEQRESQWLEEYICRFDDVGNDYYNNLEFYLPIK